MWSRTTAPLQPLTLQVKHFLAAHFAAYIGWEDYIPRLLWGLCLILWYYCIYVVHLFIIKSNFDWLVDTYCIYFAHLYLLNLFWEWILHITQFKWRIDCVISWWCNLKLLRTYEIQRSPQTLMLHFYFTSVCTPSYMLITNVSYSESGRADSRKYKY